MNYTTFEFDEFDNYTQNLFLVPGQIYIDVMQAEQMYGVPKQFLRFKLLTEQFIYKEGRSMAGPFVPDQSQIDQEMIDNIHKVNVFNPMTLETSSPNQCALVAIKEESRLHEEDLRHSLYTYDQNLPISHSSENDELYALSLAFKIRITNATKLEYLLDSNRGCAPKDDLVDYLEKLIIDYREVLTFDKKKIVQDWCKSQNTKKFTMAEATLAMFVLLEYAELYSIDQKSAIIKLIHRLTGSSPTNIRHELGKNMTERTNKIDVKTEVAKTLDLFDNEDLKKILWK
jgi:hypothetical protein